MSSDTLRTVRLYGKLGARFGREFKLAVRSTAEAVRALCVQLPGFEAELMGSKDRGIGYAVFVGKTNIPEQMLKAPVGKDDIRIAPVPMGAKKNGIGSIIMGIVLVVVGIIYGIYTEDWYHAGQLIVGGIMMIAGGVVQMLAPQPKAPKPGERPDNQPSYVFNGPVNTEAQGHPFPIVIGEMIVGSAVASAGIEVADNSYVPAGNPWGTTGSLQWWNYAVTKVMSN